MLLLSGLHLLDKHALNMYGLSLTTVSKSPIQITLLYHGFQSMKNSIYWYTLTLMFFFLYHVNGFRKKD